MLAGLILAAFTFIVSTSAQDRPPEPDGYRMEDYRAPVPATLAGARVLTTAEAEAIWRAKTGVFIDVMPRAPRPPNLPGGTVWRDKPRLNIPGSVWLPDTGYGKLAAVTEDYLRRVLIRVTAGNTAALVVGRSGRVVSGPVRHSAALAAESLSARFSGGEVVRRCGCTDLAHRW